MFVVSRKLLDDSGLDDDDEFRKSLNLVKEWAAARCSPESSGQRMRNMNVRVLEF